MDKTTFSAILEAAKAQPPELQGRWIAEQIIAAARSADAGISDQALEADFRLLYRKLFGSFPSGQAVELAIAWARHLLSGGRHA
jgi:membrane-associated phospholipid phosphatase